MENLIVEAWEAMKKLIWSVTQKLSQPIKKAVIVYGKPMIAHIRNRMGRKR